MQKFSTSRRQFAKSLLGTAALALPGLSVEPAAVPGADRQLVPLDGDWAIADTVQADSMPTVFSHTVTVPGLAHLATPPFPDVDEYQTREYIQNMIGFGLMPASADTGALGRTPQKRNYFWYRKSFRAPTRRHIAILRINKAQFGTAVWLNGKKIGEHLGCFTRGEFNLTQAIDWTGENQLIVRVGAHPGALPEWVPAGTDQEKPVWTPGIYDSVYVYFCDDPVIETVQIAPDIATSSIRIQTRLRNYGPDARVNLVQRVKTWKGEVPAGSVLTEPVHLASGETRTLLQSYSIPAATLWSPENPFLYVLDTSTGGDHATTRFGMREFHFDNISRRAVLNGKPYFLRGANITLHRFFGDPLSKRYPWDPAWVRKLLGDIPKRLHWNSFRICIGPAPEMWLDIADEVGLLLQYEYAIWTGNFRWRHELWKTEELVSEFTEFVQDNCNHPSVAIWDASNETVCDALRETVIPAVRKLDLSNRPWDNGYSVPQGPGDAYEDHPYIFSFAGKPPYYDMRVLENMQGPPILNAPASGHAAILNEYDSLFLKRDGTPTFFTRKFYDSLTGPEAPVEQRYILRAYLLGGLTEFWRAFRFYAGVMYLAFLDADLPNCITCDNFRDVERLELQPHFEDYVGEAFKPLGVYINFWQSKLSAGHRQRFHVMMVNDEYETAQGRLALGFSKSSGGAVAGGAQTVFEIPPLGQMTYDLFLTAPREPGDYVLSATATWPGRPWSPIVSRRNLRVVP